MEVFQDILLRRGLTAPPGGDTWQTQVFAKDRPAERLSEGEETGAFQGRCTKLIRQRDPVAVGRVYEPGHPEDGMRVQLKGIAEAGIHPAHDRVDALQSSDRTEEDLAISRRQISTLNERVAQEARQVGVLEVGLVGGTRGQENDARLLARAGDGASLASEDWKSRKNLSSRSTCAP